MQVRPPKHKKNKRNNACRSQEESGRDSLAYLTALGSQNRLLAPLRKPEKVRPFSPSPFALGESGCCPHCCVDAAAVGTNVVHRVDPRRLCSGRGAGVSPS
uniref:Uncharacterized protein n=1 Tax=Pseudictyota dubia TaxID=2749911 RepID=A0A7R9W1I6_9STRA|mmetsp:Transcript_28962/g.53771  ORF Transcript_28962/g.53771 Transcript_28962/m.53771 type:complete len:101 (+) Transcript_28962:937-1239(+)